MPTIYEIHGYKNRQDYLKNLSDDYSVDLDIVQSIADLLGENEDFDGLVTQLQDYQQGF